MFQLNPEQQSAVENIVYARNYPLPYILIGPPGMQNDACVIARKIHHFLFYIDSILIPESEWLVY